MVLRKDELEVQLKDEHQLIQSGVLRDDSPLDSSPEFQKLCDACRVGDLKGCQEAIAAGVNINARDLFDYTPLILVSWLGTQLPLPASFTNCRRPVSAVTTKSYGYYSNLALSANEIHFKVNDAFIMLSTIEFETSSYNMITPRVPILCSLSPPILPHCSLGRPRRRQIFVLPQHWSNGICTSSSCRRDRRTSRRN